VEVLPDYRVKLEFNDGVEGVVNLSYLVERGGVFERRRDYCNFEKAHAGEYGELAFDSEVDLCPDTLWLTVTGKLPEEL